MSTDIQTIKKEVNSFLLINFMLIGLISIFIFIMNNSPGGSDFIYNFAVTFMYIPALATIIVLKKVSKYEFNEKVEEFFKFIAIASMIRITLSIIEALFIKVIFLSGVLDWVMSIYILLKVLCNKSEFKEIDLSFTHNFKRVLFMILIFTTIFFVTSIPQFISAPNNLASGSDLFLIVLLNLFLNLGIGCSVFFGEEFGWRYFLQPRLQKLYGKKLGVIILGCIWGIWHLPLCVTLYSPNTPLYCVINHLVFCTFLGIFLGYAYMTTKNIWTPILIHLVNNCLAILLGGGVEANFTLEIVLYNAAIFGICFLPFLLTREYKQDTKISTDI